MPENILHPDKNLAIKYILAACVLFSLNYLVPVLGFISALLLFLGIKPFMHEQNNHFKIAYKSLKKMTVGLVIMIFAEFVPETEIFRVETSAAIRFIAMGIASIYYIYVTHYFTEGVLLDAKAAKINFVKLGLNTPWILLGLSVVVHFICAVTFKEPVPAITATFSLLMCIYYCLTLYHAFPIVYPQEK